MTTPDLFITRICSHPRCPRNRKSVPTCHHEKIHCWHPSYMRDCRSDTCLNHALCLPMEIVTVKAEHPLK